MTPHSDLSPSLLRSLAWSLAFVLLYVLLDWASYISPLRHLNVTLWNPAPALGLLYLVRHDSRALPVLFVAITSSELLVRGAPGSLPVTLWLSLVLTLSYGGIATLLKHHFPENGLFADRHGLLVWTLIVVGGSLVSSLLFISQLLLVGLLRADEWSQALTEFWIGDSVGIFVALPVLWWLQDAPHRLLFRKTLLRGETVAYVAFTLLVLWIAFVPGAQANYRYFYALFLPVVWAASRQGLSGAVFCIALLQIGLLFGGWLQQQTADITLFELQIRTFLLALVGFLIGASVDEQRRATSELRHSLRLAAAGEMAGALAHELNQPLTALAAYGSACQQLLQQKGSEQQLHEVIHRMIGEADRAALVMRRLRDFFRTGATKLEQFSLASLIEPVAAPFCEKAAASGMIFSVGKIPAATIHGDRLQLGVVLRNLLANACEAVAEPAYAPGRVNLEAHIENGNRVVIEITDSGPGISGIIADQLFEPFASTKSSGLGLGLAISRTIAEAHGGSLTAILAEHGRFQLVLPIE
ncbi:MAG: MASE1 domain-containing protein [Sterolibacterium sp.]|nr:MASE1 domain-containing protein [Sterolibacterium sp.]